MLRSFLVAAFSTVVAFGVLSGLSEAKGDSRADSSWPSKGQAVTIAKDSSWPSSIVEESSGGQGSA
ncbi:hypothetical protein I2W78_17735 [Streptomyces spinoverrucosus]|uniref:hypothetical protein n=1 Tax=Streptomyces spinoverrucosus TaxID=284043 RepID=UPI0018C41653|nr:hypothetical protein [Streptomyces spinoverrucosus]MBG0853637.1 hypothetical protein [Streptomyces spinoverrucosus]